jgi:hypothetical protein
LPYTITLLIMTRANVQVLLKKTTANKIPTPIKSGVKWYVYRLGKRLRALVETFITLMYQFVS